MGVVSYMLWYTDLEAKPSSSVSKYNQTMRVTNAQIYAITYAVVGVWNFIDTHLEFPDQSRDNSPELEIRELPTNISALQTAIIQ